MEKKKRRRGSQKGNPHKLVKDGTSPGFTGSRSNRNLTEAERRKCVEILAINDFNYTKTLKILEGEGFKIAKSTLFKYKKEFVDEIENRPAMYIEKFEEKLEKRDDNLIEKSFSVYEKIIKRMDELVPQERNLGVLVTAVQALHNILEGRRRAENFEKAADLIDQINERLIAKKHEQKSKYPGDIEDVPFEPVK